jgi:hypothetical protein
LINSGCQQIKFIKNGLLLIGDKITHLPLNLTYDLKKSGQDKKLGQVVQIEPSPEGKTIFILTHGYDYHAENL